MASIELLFIGLFTVAFFLFFLLGKEVDHQKKEDLKAELNETKKVLLLAQKRIKLTEKQIKFLRGKILFLERQLNSKNNILIAKEEENIELKECIKELKKINMLLSQREHPKVIFPDFPLGRVESGSLIDLQV